MSLILISKDAVLFRWPPAQIIAPILGKNRKADFTFKSTGYITVLIKDITLPEMLSDPISQAVTIITTRNHFIYLTLFPLFSFLNLWNQFSSLFASWIHAQSWGSAKQVISSCDSWKYTRTIPKTFIKKQSFTSCEVSHTKFKLQSNRY